MILIAVLFGSTLFGVVGALLAIPTAATTIQITWKEFVDYRREVMETKLAGGTEALGRDRDGLSTAGCA